MKLSPPTVAGVIPPFFADIRTGTVNLTVPFVMNKIVSTYEVAGLSLKIKDAETNAAYGTISTTDWTGSEENPYAVFNLGNHNSGTSVARKLEVGRYYKIQVAYIDLGDNVGYYSTIAIVKFTIEPTVSILDLNRYQTNNDISHYVGQYVNLGDVTEKAYQYKFTFRDIDGNILETSGWRMHNANTNTELGKSTDAYDLLYDVKPDTKYSMQYSVLTNNNLEVSSPRYQLVGNASIPPEISADLMADLDYDNGCVNLRLKQSYLKIIDPLTGQREAPKLSGSFILSRSSSSENFTIWTRLYTFHLTGQLPEGIIFSDYTCEHGQTYRYALQQYNENGIYSTRMLAEIFEKNDDGELVGTEVTDVIVNFEDMYLYDGEKQLRIRFNPEVSSFKTVLQESKKTTLGSQFPFFFRSGIIEYKEFPIKGLISYLTDNDEKFLNRINDLKMPKDWQDTTDLTDENIIYERKFKLAVLDWLNNGEVKLFRSPAEGNYLVRLMNVSLAPQNSNSLSRMIHTFSCTATEVDTYSPQKLQDYGFLVASPEIPKQLRFATINLSDYIEMLITEQSGSQEERIRKALEQFKTFDILKGFSCQYLHIEDMAPGTIFKLNKEPYYIGTTGSYEATFTNNPRGLYIPNPTRHMPGSITYGILTATSNSFDTVTSITHRDILDIPVWSTANYVETHQDIKNKINKIYFMRFYLNDLVYEFESMEHYQNYYHMYMHSQHEEQYSGGEALPGNQKESYMIYLDGYCPSSQAYAYLDQYYHKEVQTDGTVKYSYIRRGAQDLFINNTIIRTNDDGKVWRYTIHGLDNGDGTEDHYGLYATLTLLDYENAASDVGPTFVKIDDELIDVSLTEMAYSPTSDAIPTSIRWGSSVQAEICYQELTINYGVEDNVIVQPSYNRSLHNQKNRVNEIREYTTAQQLQLVPYTVNAALQRTISLSATNDSMEAYFIWTNNQFHRLSPDECANVTIGSRVWMQFTHWKYNAATNTCYYDETATNTTNYSKGNYKTEYGIFLAMIAAQLKAEDKEVILQ